MAKKSDDSDNKPVSDTPQSWAKYWQKELDAADKRLRSFKKKGTKVVERYLAQDGQSNDELETTLAGDNTFQLNFFHKNINTIRDMMMGSTPQVEVTREFADPDDDIARVAATLYQRMLQSDVEVSGSDEPCVLKQALSDHLLPGLGLARVRYEFTKEVVPSIDPQTFEPIQVEQITDENSLLEYVHWQDFSWGWARTWKEVPWIGFRAWLTKDEAEARFGKDIAKDLNYKQQTPSSGEEATDTDEGNKKNNIHKAEIHEIWDKQRKKVFWWSAGVERILDEKDDPLKLDGFWPMPAPLMANLTTTLLVPKADYIFTQDLYNEIDTLGMRIHMLTRSIKSVGVYDSSADSSVGRMIEEAVENQLIPVDNWAMFAEKGGIRGAIERWPVEDIVGVLTTLNQQLIASKELLYELTGVSDLMRGGNTDQYTSDGTNQLKAKMGSIQIQSRQDEFARFASELESIKAEVIAKHFTPQSILKQSNAQFMPVADHDKIQPAVELMQSPDIKWRINIQPESMAIADYAQLKNERVEYLTSMGSFLQAATSAAEKMPQSLPILLEFLKFGMSGFRGAKYMEGMLDSAIDKAKQMPPQQQEEGKGQQAAAAEGAKQKTVQMQHQFKMQEIQAKNQSDIQLEMVKTKSRIAEMQADMQADQSTAEAQHRQKMIEAQREHLQDLEQIQANLQSDLMVENRQAENDALVDDHETENKIRVIHAQPRGNTDGQ